MRGDLYDRFIELKNMFLNQCYGIYDTTMNIDELVACSDAYIGEEGSSVVMFFAALGKPVFIIGDNMASKEECAMAFFDCHIQGNDIYFADSEYKVICKADFETGRLEKMVPVSYCNFSASRAYTVVKCVDNKLWFAPMNGDEIPVYDMGDERLKVIEIDSVTHRGMPNYNNIICQGKDLYFIPVMNDKMLKIDVESHNITYDEKVVESLKKNAFDQGYYSMFASCIRNDVIYVASPLSNIIVAFDIKSGSVEEYNVGKKNRGYWHMICDGEHIWLNPYCGSAIVKWNPDTQKVDEYDEYPEGATEGLADRDNFLQLVDCDEYILAFPKCANMIVKIHKASGRMSKFDVELGYKEGARKNENYIWGSNYYFAKRVDNKVYALSAYDHALIIIDIQTMEVSKKYFLFNKELIDYSEGIKREKTMSTNVRRCFYEECREMSLKSFVDMIKNEELGINPVEAALVAEDFANSDGTAGIAIYELIKALV